MRVCITAAAEATPADSIIDASIYLVEQIYQVQSQTRRGQRSTGGNRTHTARVHA